MARTCAVSGYPLQMHNRSAQIVGGRLAAHRRGALRFRCLCSAARSDAQPNDLVPCGPPADRAPLLFSVNAMLVSVMLWIGGALIAAAVANCAYFYLRARRGAVPQPVRANQGL